MSIFKLMRHYFPHKNWRARLAVNSAACTIWMLWVFSTLFLITTVILLVRGGTFAQFLGCAGVAAVLFLASFLFLPEARRLHEIRRVMNNSILFGESGHEV